MKKLTIKPPISYKINPQCVYFVGWKFAIFWQRNWEMFLEIFVFSIVNSASFVNFWLNYFDIECYSIVSPITPCCYNAPIIVKFFSSQRNMNSLASWISLTNVLITPECVFSCLESALWLNPKNLTTFTITLQSPAIALGFLVQQ